MIQYQVFRWFGLLTGSQEVEGSNPFFSTIKRNFFTVLTQTKRNKFYLIALCCLKRLDYKDRKLHLQDGMQREKPKGNPSDSTNYFRECFFKISTKNLQTLRCVINGFL